MITTLRARPVLTAALVAAFVTAGGQPPVGALALAPDGMVLATQARGPAARFVFWMVPD